MSDSTPQPPDGSAYTASKPESNSSASEQPKQTPITEYRNRNFVPPETPAQEEVSINPQDYPLPHKYMWAMRGVPMGSHQGIEVPPINIPPECQHAFAVHLELCGFVHDPEKQVIVHVKPIAGDDTPMNPGTWVRASSVEDPSTISAVPSAMAEDSMDLSGMDREHLEALERVIQRAKINQDMAAQADPGPREEAEELLKKASESPAKMPTEDELRAAMDPNWGAEIEGTEWDNDAENGDDQQ